MGIGVFELLILSVLAIGIVAVLVVIFVLLIGSFKKNDEFKKK